MPPYRTQLTPEEELEFLNWYSNMALIKGLDSNPDHPDHHYDYRGFWKNSPKQDMWQVLLWNGHFPDTYKTPLHPTFSVESIYSTPFMQGGTWNGDTFIDSEWTRSRGYTPTLEDLIAFTKSYEDFSPTVYELPNAKGELQKLIGYGFADADLIARGKITQEESDQIILNKLKKIESELSQKVPNWNNLSRELQLAMIDIAYNGHDAKTIYEESPNLMALLESGITDPYILVKELNHSKSAGGWLGARSAARRAMALGMYFWNSPNVDVKGRQIRPDFKSNKDYEQSPYLSFKRGGKF